MAYLLKHGSKKGSISKSPPPNQKKKKFEKKIERLNYKLHPSLWLVFVIPLTLFFSIPDL